MLPYPGNEVNRVQQAQWFVEYYSAEGKPRNLAWAMGQLLSQQWLTLAQQENPDVYEVQMLSRVLESEKKFQGSGWNDMSWRVKQWLAEIELTTETK